jgi:hypothetical protein
VPVVHSDAVRPPKRLFPIVSAIVAASVDWKDGFGESFRRVLSSEALSGDRRIDCGCGLSHGAFDRFARGGALSFGEQNAGLVFFLFRLLDKLQSLGTVPAIDWSEYASVLRSQLGKAAVGCRRGNAV